MKIPPHIQRGLLALVVFLILVSLGRLLVNMHRQDERIAILEAQVDALLADTTRLSVVSDYKPYRSNVRYTSSSRKPKRSSERGSYAKRETYNDTTRATFSSAMSANDTPSDRPRKFSEPHLFDVNTIDSVTLIRIPGIAARTASVILQQRQRYGGFYDASQLRDFLTWESARDYLDEWCQLWFSANADRLIRIPLNTATISQLQHHPYISHEQAVEISQFRTRHKGLHQASELQQLTTFTPEEITRLLPYLSFE